MRCGLDGQTLKVFPPRGLGDFAEVVRGKQGERIFVRDDRGTANCNGVPATIANTERVRFVGRKKSRSLAAVNLHRGGFPGIDFDVLLGSKFDILFVIGRGSGRDDSVRLGSAGKRDRIDLVSEPLGGNSIALRRTERAVVIGAGGSDRLSARGAASARSDWARQLFLFGNGGRDRLFAGKKGSTLVGGGRSDKVLGGTGRDLLVGGKGRDRFNDRGGSDFLKTRDGTSESINCGDGGRDVVKRDRSDRLRRSCERVTLNRSAAGAPAPPSFRFAWAGSDLLARTR